MQMQLKLPLQYIGQLWDYRGLFRGSYGILEGSLGGHRDNRGYNILVSIVKSFALLIKAAEC